MRELVWQTRLVFEFGDVVRKLRQRHQPPLSAVGLAEAAGLNKGTVSRLERGELDPKKSTLEKIAQALGVSLVDLLRPPSEYQSALTEEGADVPASAGVAESIERIADIEAAMSGLVEQLGKERAELARLTSEQQQKRG